MQAETIIALAGISATLLASIAVAIISAWTTLKSKDRELQHSSINAQLNRREELYLEFIDLVNEFTFQAYSPEPASANAAGELVALQTKLALISGKAVTDSSDHFCSAALGIHQEPDRENAKNDFEKNRNAFLSACKEELNAIRKKT